MMMRLLSLTLLLRWSLVPLVASFTPPSLRRQTSLTTTTTTAQQQQSEQRPRRESSAFWLSSSSTLVPPEQTTKTAPPTPFSSNQLALQNLPGAFPRTWIPLASVTELDPQRPTPLRFFNQPYVTFRDAATGQWIVMDDACPHRLAPLSEGRVVVQQQQQDNGNSQQDNSPSSSSSSTQLQCAYHGWSFDAEGQCQEIPQATTATARAAQQNPQCHVPTYTTVVHKNLLWAWLWPTTTSEDNFNNDPLQTVLPQHAWKTPEAMMEGIPASGSSYTRDVPYGWDTLTENLIDPAHIPFAHHNLQGTRSDAIPINVTSASPLSEAGFSFSFQDRTMKKLRQATGTFRAPYVITYDGTFENDNNNKFELTTIQIPTRPGWSRVIVLMGAPADDDDDDDDDEQDNNNKDDSVVATTEKKKKKKTSLAARIFKAIPVWLIHVLNNRFLDSDLAFLHYQEYEVDRRRQWQLNDKNNNNNKNDLSTSAAALNNNVPYFVPTPSDRGVVMLRQWIAKYAHIPARPSFKATNQVPAVNRKQLFDRWSQHTQHCVHCRHAYEKVLPRLRKISLGLGFTSWIASVVASASSTTTLSLKLGLVVAAGFGSTLVAVGIWNVASWLEVQLTQGEFEHFQND